MLEKHLNGMDMAPLGVVGQVNDSNTIVVPFRVDYLIDLLGELVDDF